MMCDPGVTGSLCLLLLPCVSTSFEEVSAISSSEEINIGTVVFKALFALGLLMP